MKVVVIGGSGLIGKKLVPLLRQHGHEAVPASPSTGVNALTGEGVADALNGADVVVDVSNSPSWADAEVMAFFDASTRNLLAAEKTAGVRHHVALSVVGADRMPDSGYMRAKVNQEKLITAGGVPYTVVRATQFFEFLGWIAGEGGKGDTVRLPTAPMQPLAADDVTAALADVCGGPPANGVVELAGPETAPIAEFVGRYLTASGDKRAVVADPKALYSGGPGRPRPRTRANPRLGPTRFEDWASRAGLNG
ncbi:MAG: SDR family oxidoreductase [Gemmataceae bacterium]